MNRYEGMFLVDNAVATDDWDNLVNDIQDILTKHGSEVIETVNWGEKKLAYKIGNHTRATYVLTQFNAPGLAISKVRKEFELSDKIIRALVVRDDHPEDSIPADVAPTTEEESKPVPEKVESVTA